MKKQVIERDTYNTLDCLYWDDGKPLTNSESIAWWAGWNEGNDDGRADMKDELRDEIERLREALYEVACVDIQTLARAALEKDGETRVKLLERIAQYDMQKLAIDALKEGKE
jgi:hypothetical protein